MLMAKEAFTPDGSSECDCKSKKDGRILFLDLAIFFVLLRW